MTDGNNRFLGNRALSPETLMMGYGYDPFLSERSLKPPVFIVAKRVNHRGCCEIQRDADSPLEEDGFEPLVPLTGNSGLFRKTTTRPRSSQKPSRPGPDRLTPLGAGEALISPTLS